MAGGSGDSVSMAIPAEASVLPLVRVFATAIGRHLGLSLDGIEDLKLALTELCAEAIGEDGGSDPSITLEVAALDAAPILSVSSSGGRRLPPERGEIGDQRRRLLEALLPGLEPTEDGSGVRCPLPGLP